MQELDGDVKATEAISEKEEVASENTEVPPLSNGDNKEDLEEKGKKEKKGSDKCKQKEEHSGSHTD